VKPDGQIKRLNLILKTITKRQFLISNFSTHDFMINIESEMTHIHPAISERF
jgi:hypothetical protein